MSRPSVVIVSPALADANNGNWQTARRWASFLTDLARVRIVKDWPDERAPADDLMIGLHARRSAPSIAAWARARGSSRLAVVLTGTDLYKDIRTDASAQHSLEAASHLVVLQELGIERDTLVVFMNDNGGTGGVQVFNAGMRGRKGTPWLGGTRAASFWRSPSG